MYMSSPPTKKINVRYCFWKNVIAYVKMATTCNVIENTRETKNSPVLVQNLFLIHKTNLQLATDLTCMQTFYTNAISVYAF